jgi:hypothetical protein
MAMVLVRSVAVSPSSHAMMVTSLLFNVTTVSGGGEDLHTPISNGQHHGMKQAQTITDARWSPTCSPPRPGQGQPPPSSGEVVVVGHRGYSPHPKGVVDVSYAAPQVHRIINVALHREYSPGIVFIFSQGWKDLYHV